MGGGGSTVSVGNSSGVRVGVVLALFLLIFVASPLSECGFMT